MHSKTVFVTVGTTCFDSLIECLISDEFLDVLLKLGYKRLLLQIGRGTCEPPSETRQGIEISWYRFKPNIREDLLAADLVISHAGAGSVLETLGLDKRLLVVINEALMGNHQIELAEAFAQEGFLIWTTIKKLCVDLPLMDWNSLKPYRPGRPDLFAKYMDNFFGN